MSSNGKKSTMSSESKDLEDYEMVFTAKDVQKAVDKAVAAAIGETKSEAAKKIAMVQDDLNKQMAKLKGSQQSNEANLIKCEESLVIFYDHIKGLATKVDKKLAARKASMKALQDQLDATREELRIARGGRIDGHWR